jgi:UDP-2,3-diacylglucosamine hydrolase
MAPASRFLPSDFGPERTVAIIAGKGRYPALLAECARSRGAKVALVAFEDETDPALFDSFPEDRSRSVAVGKLGRLLEALSELGAGGAVMAGQVTPRKLFSGMVPDLKLVALLARLKQRNAETIFGAVSAEIEATGVRMLDARAFLDDHLASAGCMTGRSFGADAEEVAFGVRMAREMARLDVGQSVVTAKGTVIAVEAFEGTDNMLRRCAATGGKEMLLTKASKRGQDWRFDVPCFGLRTLESMAEGKVARASLETDGVLILDRPAVITRARELGIELNGFAPLS